MRVAILTFSTAYNYGALLQAYGLQHFLLKNGCDVFHIVRGKIEQPKKLKSKIKRKIAASRNKKYESFLSDHLKFHTGCYTRENVSELNRDFDAFISGSDQVWNVKNGIDPVWFQDFVNHDKLKISYAASLGLEHIPIEYSREIARRLDSFDAISVREKSAVAELSKFTDIPISWNIDPVFLVDANHWGELAGEPIEKTPYIFVYGTEMSEAFKTVAYELSERTGLRILSVFPMKRAKSVDWVSGPLEFINYIRNAEYVVTTSFHATAFSIIFHKRLIEFLHSSTGSRARSLLQLFQQEHCVYDGNGSLPEIWDYSETDSIIGEEQEKAETYLKGALSGKRHEITPRDRYLEWVGEHKGSDVIGHPETWCTGCGMCTALCPVGVIKMKKRENGFFYAEIDTEKCIHCNLCHKNCPAVNEESKSITEVKQVYALKSLDKHIMQTSSSGGAFVHLSNKVLDRNGVIYGAKFDDNWNVVIGRAETPAERDAFKGSKYVQSDASASYKMVEDDLKKGRLVLFSGVPCQVNALKTYLTVKKVDASNLYSVDLVCHGCPNPTVWQQHLEDIKRKNGNSQIKYITFRRKDGKGNSQALYIEFENGKAYFARSGHDLYYNYFLQNYLLRPSCYACRFTSTHREGDLTLADWWGDIE